MSIFGKECGEYLKEVWPFMLATLIYGVVELVLFKYEVFNFRTVNWFSLPGLLLIIFLGIVMQKKGFNKRQTIATSLQCFLMVLWLPPLMMPNLLLPWYYKLLNLAIIYLMNAALYAVLSLFGWLIGSVMGKGAGRDKKVKRKKRR
jgi:hypothetical protein